MREFYLISKAKEILRVERDDILVNVGDDDCAVVRVCGNLVMTSDCLHEKTDFPSGMTPEEIGHTAIAVNLSDLAGSGARPLYFMYTITLSERYVSGFEEILRGIRKTADRFGVAVIGGDTDFGDELHISGFAVGVAERYVTQSGARAGDIVCLTGPLGKAQLSLEMLLSGVPRDKIPYPESLFRPEPRVWEGVEIARHASSMTDVSDSLAVSLHMISDKSGVGVEIYEDLIPLNHLMGYVDREKALELFLYSGGDYELVYTSKECTHGFRIGRVFEGEGVWLVRRDGRREEVEFRGYVR